MGSIIQNSSIRLEKYTVGIILTASLVLRWILVLRGGQYYFSDEGRYETSRNVVKLLLQGSLPEALSQVFIAPEHLGFKIIGILPALIENITTQSFIIPGLFFSLFSVINLYIIYMISMKSGAGQRESLYALFVASICMSLLYFARHLMPYDPAMTFGLLAIYSTMDKKAAAKASLGSGALGLLCFITYNGYWTLAAAAMLLHLVSQQKSIVSLLRSGAWTAAGFIAPAVGLFTLAMLAGTNLLAEYRSFSTTVSQGDFAEGWSLPFEYFWHTEHFIFVALLVFSIFALFKVKENKRTVLMWAGTALCIYVCLLVFSVFLHSFVVYGRLARQVIPFLILPAASGLSELAHTFPSGQKLVQVILAGIVLQAAWNYKASYDLTYPRDFAWEAQTRYPEFEFSEKRLAFGAPTLCQNNGYIAEYVKRFDVPPIQQNPPIVGQILLAAPHPDTFLPYQYEGYTNEQRTYLRRLEPETRLYKAADDFMSGTNPIWTTMKNCRVNE